MAYYRAYPFAHDAVTIERMLKTQFMLIIIFSAFALRTAHTQDSRASIASPTPQEVMILEAISKGDGPTVEKLLSAGVTPNRGLHKGWSLLEHAVHAYPRNPEVIKSLIKHGAEVKVPDNLLNSLLHMVAEPDVMTLLIQKGLNVNSVNKGGQSSLHIWAREGKVDSVRTLLKHKALPNARDASDFTPLDLALCGPIDHRPADGPPPDFQGETPKYLAIISALLVAGADTKGVLDRSFKDGPCYNDAPEYKPYRDQALKLVRGSTTPVASEFKPRVAQVNYEIPRQDRALVFRMVSERFVNKSDVARLDTGQDASLICNMPVLEAAKDLFKANPTLAKTFPGFLNSLRLPGSQNYEAINGIGRLPKEFEFQGYTLLHMAAYYNDVPLIKELVASGANPNALDYLGNTALMYAVRGEAMNSSNYLSTVDTLLGAGTKINTKNQKGETALFSEAGMTLSGSEPTAHLQLVKFLIKKGADINLMSAEGKSVMNYLISAKESVERYKDKYPAQAKQYQKLISQLKPNFKPKRSTTVIRTGFSGMLRQGQYEQIPILIKQGEKPTSLDLFELMSKDTLDQRGKEALQLLLDSGISPNICKEDYSPLYEAAWRGSLEAVEVLVRNGAKIDYCTKDPREVAPRRQSKGKQVLAILEAAIKTGPSIQPILVAKWNNTKDCRLRDPL